MADSATASKCGFAHFSAKSPASVTIPSVFRVSSSLLHFVGSLQQRDARDEGEKVKKVNRRARLLLISPSFYTPSS
jgi:hypothetical protein